MLESIVWNRSHRERSEHFDAAYSPSPKERELEGEAKLLLK
jgi:hypothetical protein